MTNIVEWKDEELPPVGVIVELVDCFDHNYSSTLRDWSKGDKLECVAHKHDAIGNPMALFWNNDKVSVSGLVKKQGNKELYRKIKTDREKTIEAAASVLKSKFWHINNEYAAELLFEEGMLKLPD